MTEREDGNAPLLRLESLTVRFGTTTALDALSLAVARNTFVALLGGSGSGKSTLLRAVAGFVAPASGRVLLEGQDLAKLPPQARPVGMVFQSYALFPHLSVFDNVAYGLRRARTPRAETARRVAEVLALVGLEGLEARRPHQLSGGQRQRVALVRALVRRPPLLLLDEPLAALDANLRERTGQELRALQRATGAAFVMVTHDQAEALALADAVAILEGGRLLGHGPPQVLYERPASRRVAAFLGAANLLDAAPREGGLLACPAGPTLRPAAPPPPGTVAAALRPERLRLLSDGAAPAVNGAAGTVQTLSYRGESWAVTVALPGGATLRAHLPATAPPPTPGTAVALAWDDAAVLPLTA